MLNELFLAEVDRTNRSHRTLRAKGWLVRWRASGSEGCQDISRSRRGRELPVCLHRARSEGEHATLELPNTRREVALFVSLFLLSLFLALLLLLLACK